MPRTSTRRWKGCQMCKPQKNAALPDRERIPYQALKDFPVLRGLNRHDPGLFEGDERYRGKKKNTKDWCRGKPGQDHVPVVTKRAVYATVVCGPRTRVYGWPEVWTCFHCLMCDRCGKILQWRVSSCPDRTNGEQENSD